MAGRKSSANLSIVPPSTGKDSRLSVPRFLTTRQAQLWKEITNSKPANWFTRDMQSLLVGYVKAIASHEALSKRVDSVESGELQLELKDENRLYAMQERQARLMQSFATKLRLTQQSRWQPKTAWDKGSRPDGVRPWDH